ncbi:polysaccharide deacetylase family protein [Neoaquamicrobium sediminum]|uniref:polysaccharide deacetylase family protein n=1 Tax=Neoaquamicrobium sediminum TaxID=1849104 RepID=UPI001566563A|nr:polysaccharide deacetylase [Mesorhizobium sediminum]NRC57239.1 polysaccharide deacetylase [Mesorhizobium sediminum]
MPRHIACLTFDADAMSGLISRGLTTPTPVSRGEFSRVAVPRILALLEKYDVHATFFIPGVVIETYPELSKAVHAAGHEIGNHSYTHVPPANLSAEKEENDLRRASELIEKVTGKKPVGYRSPSFDLSPVTADLLIKHGFLYESSMMGHDHSPYRVRTGDNVQLEGPVIFGSETPLIEMPVSWNLDDFPHFEFLRTQAQLMPGLMAANGVLQNWVDDFKYMHDTEEWGVLTYTFHPYVIGRGHRMIFLEKLICELKNMNAVFLSLEEAANEFQQRLPI